MYTPFEELKSTSRIWVYPGSRAFTVEEEQQISTALKAFCMQWNAHGEPLKSSFKIEAHQFIIMAVEEDYHSPSGCSIDSSVGVLRQIQQATGVNLLDRSQAAFEIDGIVKLIPLTELKAQFQTGNLQPDTITFNTLVATKDELATRWRLPAEKTWLTKYLPKTTLTQ